MVSEYYYYLGKTRTLNSHSNTQNTIIQQVRPKPTKGKKHFYIFRFETIRNTPPLFLHKKKMGSTLRGAHLS